MRKRCPRGRVEKTLSGDYCLDRWHKGDNINNLYVIANSREDAKFTQHFGNFESEEKADKLIRELKNTGWHNVKKVYMKKR